MHPAVGAVGRPAAAALEHALRNSSRRGGIALLYHSVDPVRGNATRELVPAHDTRLFEAQVRYVRDRYRIVRAEQLVDAAAAREPGERFPVAITFDDDLGCHTSIVAPALLERQATATFFLTGASLEEPFTFWWQHLQRAFDEGAELELEDGHDNARRNSSIHELGRAILRMSPAARDSLSTRLAESVDADPQPDGLTAVGVRTLVDAGMSVGFHTRRHDPMPSLDDAALENALRRGRPELEAVVGSRLATIAYPHGHVDARVAEAARDAGFVYGFTTRSEPVTPTSDPLLLGRVIPSLRSVGHFALQLAWTLKRSPIEA